MPGKTTSFECVIFDWDGTLMDSIQGIVNAVKASADELGVDVLEDDIIRAGIGLGFVEQFERLFSGQAIDVASFRACFREHYYGSKRRAKPSFFPGVVDMLQRLQSRGYDLAIATGMSRLGLDSMLPSLTDQGISFAVTQCADESRSKPHPDMLLQILDYLGLEASQAVMIGDSECDIQAANNAGMASIGVTTGAFSSQQLQKHSPLTVLESITDLDQWV